MNFFVGTLETVSYIGLSVERGSTVPYLLDILRYLSVIFLDMCEYSKG